MSGSMVPATRVASAGVYPPACSSACAKTGTKRPSSAGSAARIGGVLLAGKEGSLIGPRTAIRLHPFPACAVQRTNPHAHLFRTEGRVGHFQHDTANVLVGEVIVTGELQVVQGALHVEEKWIAAPAGEEAVVPRLSQMCIRPRRDRCSSEDCLSFVAHPGDLLPFSTAQRCGLCPALVGGEAHSVSNIGDSIAVRVNPKLIHRFRREGFVCRGPRRVHSGRWMYIHNQDRLARVPRLGEGIQVCKVESSIAMGKAKVRTGIMV